MSIKRYNAIADTSITNAFKEGMVIRATGSNLGASDTLELFSLYGQQSGSLEKMRILINFPIDDIKKDRQNGLIPTSGNVNFSLKMFNTEHTYTLPREFYIGVYPLSQSWEEGYGIDQETFTDPGEGMIGGRGANWMSSSDGIAWSTTGSSFITSSVYSYSQYFKIGNEDLNVDITNLVEDWISNSINNHGLIIKLSGSFEDGTKETSFYTKKFFSRGTQYFYKKPVIELAWEDAIKDDRNEFYSTSSLLSNSDNTYNLFFYNRYNGKLKNIYNNPDLQIKLYSDSSYLNEVNVLSSSVTNPSVGIYKASIRVGTKLEALYDKWILSASDGSESNTYYKGSFDIYQYSPSEEFSQDDYIYSLTNLKTVYNNKDNAQIRIFSRQKNWKPNIYSVAYNTIENSVIKNLFYKIFRLDDGLEIIGYSTGSIAYTKTSYDAKGNYFILDMSLLEPNNTYGIKLARYDGNTLEEFSNTFKFRVE